MGSQVQDTGDRGDASAMDDSRKGTLDCCSCERKFQFVTSYNKHAAICSNAFAEHEEGISWVACKLCKFKAKSLGKHLSSIHNISKAAYIEKFPNASIKCSDTLKNYSRQNATNGQWITRSKLLGADLSDYREKMSKSVSSSVMSNPKERARRSEQMAANNKTLAARELSRNTAKKTSARPEILQARAKRLASWRENNFEEFYEKCIKTMHATWHSKPELALFELLKNYSGYNFKLNQVVKSDNFETKSKRKQIDIADKDARFYVEFDGIIHFESRVKGIEILNQTKKRDKTLDAHINDNQWTLVRISYDQFSYKDGGKFSEDCLKRLFDLLCKPTPGVHYIGASYSAVDDTVSE